MFGFDFVTKIVSLIDFSAAGASKDPVLEEILYTCRELQAGVTETVAYEHFGKRAGVQEYICLCTLLQQALPAEQQKLEE